MVFGFCGTGTLACAVGQEQVSCARFFSRAARCPLIPLSSLSEPAGAGPELARVGEPRRVEKMIVGTSSMLMQCVLTQMRQSPPSLITPITSSRLIILIGLQPCAQRLSVELGGRTALQGRERDIHVINFDLYKQAREEPELANGKGPERDSGRWVSSKTMQASWSLP
jgi:hypothetical protein